MNPFIQSVLSNNKWKTPSLDLDFLNQEYKSGGVTKTFDEVVSLPRATPRWVWNESGELVELAGDTAGQEYYNYWYPSEPTTLTELAGNLQTYFSVTTSSPILGMFSNAITFNPTTGNSTAYCCPIVEGDGVPFTVVNGDVIEVSFYIYNHGGAAPSPSDFDIRAFAGAQQTYLDGVVSFSSEPVGNAIYRVWQKYTIKNAPSSMNLPPLGFFWTSANNRIAVDISGFNITKSDSLLPYVKSVTAPSVAYQDPPTPAQPCFEYDPVTHEPRGLYLNAASVTNTIGDTHDISITSSNVYDSVTEVDSVFPISVQKAGKFTKVSEGSPPYRTQNITERLTPSSQVLTYTNVVEFPTNGKFTVIARTITNAHNQFSISFGAGGVTVQANPQQIIDYKYTVVSQNGPNGGPVCECSVSFSGDSLGSSVVADGVILNNYNSSSVGDYIVWHHQQLTATVYPAHPIPTNGTAVTVAGDSCSLANLPIDYGTPGALMLEFEALTDTTSSAGIEYLSSGEYNSRYLCLTLPGNGREIRSYDGSNITNVQNTGPIANKISKFVLAWDADTAKISYNGGGVSSGNHNGTFGTRSEIRLFTASGNGAVGYVRRIQFIPSATILSDAQCIEESTI